jgi:hypothetical protein
MTTEHTARVLHAARLLGFAETPQVADRSGLADDLVAEVLLDQQALGRVARSEFADTGGWSLTETGRTENERLLAVELDAVRDGRALVHRVHLGFLPVNAALQRACTDWQLRPTTAAPLAANDHSDPAWDGQVLTCLATVADELRTIESDLVAVLPRFAGYHDRFTAALTARRVDESDGSCHRVWFELHEDLIATLGLTR